MNLTWATPVPWHSLRSQGCFLPTGRSCTQQHNLSGVASLPAAWPHDSFSIISMCTFFPMKVSLDLVWCCYSHIVPLHLVIPESEGKQEWEKIPHLTSQMIAVTMFMAGLPFLIPLAFCSPTAQFEGCAIRVTAGKETASIRGGRGRKEKRKRWQWMTFFSSFFHIDSLTFEEYCSVHWRWLVGNWGGGRFDFLYVLDMIFPAEVGKN